uniref:Uncharacterized protein n=1 Tax=Meloidogyne hapla TaxID=6305 RepID=A0A1I8B673_MELHA
MNSTKTMAINKHSHFNRKKYYKSINNIINNKNKIKKLKSTLINSKQSSSSFLVSNLIENNKNVEEQKLNKNKENKNNEEEKEDLINDLSDSDDKNEVANKSTELLIAAFGKIKLIK